MIVLTAALAATSAVACRTSAGTGTGTGAGTGAVTPRILLFDDFDAPALDTTLWRPGLHQSGSNNNGVVPQNLALRRTDDAGRSIGVLVAQANGDQYSGPVRGVRMLDKSLPIGDPRAYQRQSTGRRTGGLVWTNRRYGAGRYEVRMTVLPLSGGCACMWNYYDPQGAVLPQQATGGTYTEIDIEIPAHDALAMKTGPPRHAGLNTFVGPTGAEATLQTVDLPQATGFHVYRWDWYSGEGGRVEFYIDGRLVASDTRHVPRSPAQLWVGNWPAPWSGTFAYATQYQYIDWVRISELPATAEGGVTG